MNRKQKHAARKRTRAERLRVTEGLPRLRGTTSQMRREIARLAACGRQVYAIKVSGGNDSIALIQWMHERIEGPRHDRPCIVLHNDTGWSHPRWNERLADVESFVARLGMTWVRLSSVGFVAAVRLRRGFPRHGMQFCTTELKIRPTIEWLESIDPSGDLVCVVGVRREESARRANWPEHVDASDLDGGRELWAPLVRVTEVDRDALLTRAGFERLDHRSDECFPCVNSNRGDLRRVIAEAPQRIDEIEQLEAEMSEGHDVARRMFRRQSGIRETAKWAASSPGKYIEGQLSLPIGCDGGMCGI